MSQMTICVSSSRKEGRKKGAMQSLHLREFNGAHAVAPFWGNTNVNTHTHTLISRYLNKIITTAVEQYTQ